MSYAELPIELRAKGREYLNKYLKKVESEFGLRDKRFNIMGVFHSGNGPHVSLVGDNVSVVIRSDRMQASMFLAYYISHECVHLLNPKSGPASRLEEGVASEFQNAMMREEFGAPGDAFFQKGLTESYRNAQRDYLSLRSIDSRAAFKVREAFKRLTGPEACDLRELFPTIDMELADRLVIAERLR